MKSAIYTVINDNITKSIFAIIASYEKNKDVAHYIFYFGSEHDVSEYEKHYSHIRWIDLEWWDDKNLFNSLQELTRYVDFNYHNPIFFSIVKYFKAYDYAVYISSHVHILNEFKADAFVFEYTLAAPQIATPIDTDFITNSFKETHAINDNVYLASDIIIFNSKAFIDNQIEDKMKLFFRNLYYQTRIQANEKTSLTRIGLETAFNLFCASGVEYKYLPQNYLLDIEYTNDYSGQVIGLYQLTELDYEQRLDSQPQFLEIDYEENIYHLEYMVLYINFLNDHQLVRQSIIDFNLQYLSDLIIMRNKIYQKRLII